MDSGWVCLWRKSIESGWLKNHNVWIFWTYCLMKANHKKDYKQVVGFQEFFLQPGQFVFGRKQASIETGLSEQNIRTCINFLKKSKNLTIKSTNKFSIISIIKWDTYQVNSCCLNQQPNQHLTSSQPASNQQVTTNNNITTKQHNHKTIKKHSSCDTAQENDFKKFWDLYSKKQDLKKCESKWNKLKQSDKDKIFETLPAYIESTPDIKYRKNPLTYLNGNCWNDEIIKDQKNGQHKNYTGNDTRPPVIPDHFPEWD